MFATAQLMTDLAKGVSQHDYKLNIFTGTQSNSAIPDFLTQVKIIRAFSVSWRRVNILERNNLKDC